MEVCLAVGITRWDGCRSSQGIRGKEVTRAGLLERRAQVASLCSALLWLLARLLAWWPGRNLKTGMCR